MLQSLLAISLGASLGAVMRWVLSAALNTIFAPVPPGTWLSNMIGGYLMGIAMAYFAEHGQLGPEWRLFVITGFLGGLTTFSTFSAEVTTLLQQGRMAWAGMAISAHVLGSLLMTMLGLATYALAKST